VRRGALGLLALLWAAPGWAGAFDSYQVIMWQERTPAQVEGLARLGFTGTKLRATGGQIDPAELAHHRQSGLPWYLENIATDFYSPYHRYTPGKPVTWLFDAAKARRRADPADTSVFVREPSLSDPAWLERVTGRLRDVVGRQREFRPLFYNLADEAGIGDLAAVWDADIGPASLAGMRAWLRTQYPSLDALNAQWGTHFANWDEVVPELTDAALRRTDGNYSAWGDFKAWMDVAFARAVRVGTDAVHLADPDALAGLEGTQLPGWGGYDYGLLAPAVDVMEIYDTGNALDLARAFAPNLVLLRTSFGAGPYEWYGAWRHLLHGGSGLIVWDEADNVVAPDGSPGPRGQDLGAMIARLRQVAPEIRASEPVRDPVAVLVSQASFRMRWLLDRQPGGTSWSDRDAAREYEDNDWRASRREMLERLAGVGVQPRLLSSAMVENGALQRDGLRVLYLPHAIALSAREASEIAAFQARGGVVLADTEPGLFDQHGRLLPKPSLAGVVTVQEAMQRTGSAPTWAALESTVRLLQAAGVAPRALFRTSAGRAAPGLDIRWFRHGERDLLSIQSATPYAAPGEIEVELATPATVRDLRQGGAVMAQAARRFTVKLDPFEPTILALDR
jgi:hypothetical protein